MSKLTIELDDVMARDVAKAASVSKKPVPDWVKAQLADALKRQSLSDVPIARSRAGREWFGPPPSPVTTRVLGLHEGEDYFMADDFDAPLEEFKEYM